MASSLQLSGTLHYVDKHYIFVVVIWCIEFHFPDAGISTRKPNIVEIIVPMNGSNFHLLSDANSL